MAGYADAALALERKPRLIMEPSLQQLGVIFSRVLSLVTALLLEQPSGSSHLKEEPHPSSSRGTQLATNAVNTHGQSSPFSDPWSNLHSSITTIILY